MTFDLYSQLGVTEVGEARYTGLCLGGAGGRIFGGQVVAQSLAAAGASVARHGAGQAPASVHAHFLAPGRTSDAVEYGVTTLKNGRSFAVRRVEARQGDRLIATVTATFHEPEEAPTHQADAPIVIGPEAARPLTPKEIGGNSPAFDPIEARWSPEWDGTPSLRMWARARGPMPADRLAGACALVWLSDLTMTRTVDRTRQHWGGSRVGASLDHAVWFHAFPDPGGWCLLDQVSDVYRGARGMARSAIYDETGLLVATATQDCLIRRPAVEPVERSALDHQA